MATTTTTTGTATLIQLLCVACSVLWQFAFGAWLQFGQDAVQVAEQKQKLPQPSN